MVELKNKGETPSNSKVNIKFCLAMLKPRSFRIIVRISCSLLADFWIAKRLLNFCINGLFAGPQHIKLHVRFQHRIQGDITRPKDAFFFHEVFIQKRWFRSEEHTS